VRGTMREHMAADKSERENAERNIVDNRKALHD
jgi:hypothetical protein